MFALARQRVNHSIVLSINFFPIITWGHWVMMWPYWCTSKLCDPPLSRAFILLHFHLVNTKTHLHLPPLMQCGPLFLRITIMLLFHLGKIKYIKQPLWNNVLNFGIYKLMSFFVCIIKILSFLFLKIKNIDNSMLNF